MRLKRPHKMVMNTRTTITIRPDGTIGLDHLPDAARQRLAAAPGMAEMLSAIYSRQATNGRPSARGRRKAKAGGAA